MSVPGLETSSTDGVPRLTARELQVLEQVAFGLRNREIGERLGISEQTVKNHMWNLLRKLSLPDRTRAAVVAIDQGWIPVTVGRDSGASLGRDAPVPPGTVIDETY
jgi:DNA-binding NarL/FixJ family response regulator